jgi:hypothetical protein
MEVLQSSKSAQAYSNKFEHDLACFLPLASALFDTKITSSNVEA